MHSQKGIEHCVCPAPAPQGHHPPAMFTGVHCGPQEQPKSSNMLDCTECVQHQLPGHHPLTMATGVQCMRVQPHTLQPMAQPRPQTPAPEE
eukprot:scaffold7080_cov22-Tisochrysis_lutea.AAC.4